MVVLVLCDRRTWEAHAHYVPSHIHCARQHQLSRTLRVAIAGVTHNINPSEHLGVTCTAKTKQHKIFNIQTMSTSCSTSENGADGVDKEKPIHAVRLGCILNIMHLSVTAGLESNYFMGPMGSGSWHEWKKNHLVALLGTLWYTVSRSGSCKANFEQFKNLVTDEFETSWTSKFVRPAETRWMVIWEGAKLLDERWEEVELLFTVWSPSRLYSSPFQQYWMQGALMMSDPSFRLQAKLAKALGKKILNWAFNLFITQQRRK